MKAQKIRRGTPRQHDQSAELFGGKSDEKIRKRKKPELFVQVSLVDDTRLEVRG